MTALPTSTQIQKFIAEARAELTVIELYHRAALRVARDHEAGLKAASGGRAPKGDHGDPTGTAVANLTDGSTLWAPQINHGYQNGLTELHAFAATILAAGSTRTNTTRTQTPCANPHGCPDDLVALPGKQGRCYSCWRYWKTHDGIDRRDRYDRTGQHHSSLPNPELDAVEAKPITEPRPSKPKAKAKGKSRQKASTRTKTRRPTTPQGRVDALRERLGR